MEAARVSAILLAAGLSRRMEGRDKLRLVYGGMTLLERAVRLLDSLPFYEKILVTAPARFCGIALPPSVRTVMNPFPEDGQSGSVRLGVSAASGKWYLFLMADQPRLSAENLLPLLALARENDKIIFPTVNGRPCSPTLFPARFRAELLSLTGDTGGRTVREAHPEACLGLEVKYPNDFRDIDSESDYTALGDE